MAATVIARSIAVVLHAGCVLLVESKRTPGAWVPPGGKLEPGEALPDAAARETFEETGVKVQVDGLIAYRQVHDGSRNLLELYFSARPVSAPSGEHTTGVERRPAKWVALEALSTLPHFPGELAELCAVSGVGGQTARGLAPIDLTTPKT